MEFCENYKKSIESHEEIRQTTVCCGACVKKSNANGLNFTPGATITTYKQILKRKKYMTTVACMVISLVVTAIGFGIVASYEYNKKTQEYIGGGTILRIVAREGWLAQPPLNPWVPLDLPVQRVIIIHTRTMNCETQAACTFTVRNTQTFYIESQQQDDIIYNFLIGGDGNVYEGRGWGNKGSTVKGYNDDSITLAFIGSFQNQKPSDKQMNVTKLLLEEGVRLGKLTSDYRIVGANKLDLASTAASADALYASPYKLKFEIVISCTIC